MASKTRALLYAMAGAGTPAALRAVRRGRSVVEAVRRRADRALPGPRRARRGGRLRASTWTAIPAGERPAVRVPGRDDRQPLPVRARRRSWRALRELMGPTDRLLLGHRPGQGPRRARGRLQRQRGRDGGVQPQRAAGAQPRARRATSTPTRSSTWRSSTRPTRGSRCGCAPTARSRCAIDGARPGGRVRRRRGDAHRDQRASSRRSAVEPRAEAAGLRTGGASTPTGRAVRARRRASLRSSASRSARHGAERQREH